MFSFLEMAYNYEERKVENTEINGAVIDTCFVNDSTKDYETAIKHSFYNNNKWVIVELYDTKEEAKKGHKKWVKIFEESLPEYLEDKSTAKIKQLFAKFGDNENKYYKNLS